VDPKIVDPFIQSIQQEAEKAMAQNIQPVLLTSPTLRRHLRKMIEYFIPSMTVLSQSELLGDIRIKSIGEVSFNNAN
jgi:flagellar biosynthesis protein FlhA